MFHIIELTSLMVIIDHNFFFAISKINAMANRAAGKGYENVAHYENIDFHFIGIENIHVMRQSLQKMIEDLLIKNAES